MKINKILFGLAIAIVGVMTSCNTDVEGVTYSPSGQNVSFETAAPATVTTSETSITIPVRIVRSVTASEYTATFTTEASEEGIFSNDANGAVTFTAGQGVAIINVKADNMEKGVDYTYTLKLSDADVADRDTITKKQNASVVIKIHSDYNWVSAGACTFVDYTFTSAESGSAARNVPIIHAEGTNLYRIVQPFIAIYGTKTFSSDSSIEFYYESDNSINFGMDEGYIYVVYDDANNYGLWDTKKYPNYCTIEQNGNVYNVNHLLQYGTSLYIAGFAFQWTTGWPGQQ